MKPEELNEMQSPSPEQWEIWQIEDALQYDAEQAAK